MATERLSLTPAGTIRYRLKTPYRDGTTDIVFEPLDFIARLAALVPKPRVNLTRFHGVFAPNSRWRAQVTPAGRGRGRRPPPAGETPSAGDPHRAMTWAQRLKRVFNIDIETCARCGADEDRRQHRRPGGDQDDPRPPGQDRVPNARPAGLATRRARRPPRDRV